MALQLSLQIPKSYPTTPSPRTSSYPQTKTSLILTKPFIKQRSITAKTTNRKTTQFTVKAAATAAEEEEEKPQTNNNDDVVSEPQTEPQPQPTDSTTTDLSQLGSEIKAAMKERESGGGGGGELWSGVAEEIKEIEWPAFGKVVGITGVVLGVIAGSSVVLLTVNAVLAELSDRVFAGRGVQDFFG